MALRGDNDLFSLMNELSSQQGYQQQNDARRQEDEQTVQAKASSHPRIRLLPEAKGYHQNSGNDDDDDNDRVAPTRTSWVVWNASARVSSEIPSNQHCPTRFCAPTNPQVEVLRRRAYEKFKEEWRQIMERTAAAAKSHKPGNHKNKNKEKQRECWNQLNPSSLLERWHMDAKLQEYLSRRDAVVSNSSAASTTTLDWMTAKLEWTTEEVHRSIRHAQQQQQNSLGYYDPILVTPTNTDHAAKRKRSRSSNHNKPILTDVISPRIDPTVPLSYAKDRNPLRDEIQFEYARVWKASGQDTTEQQPLERFLQSNKFRRKVSGINRAVRGACHEANDNFMRQLVKRVHEEQTASGKRRRQRQRNHNKGLPKVTTKHNPDRGHGHSNNNDDDNAGAGDDDLMMTVSYSGLSFSIHHAHYQKLQILFDRQQPHSPSREAHYAGFVSALFCLLCRYDMLQGAGLQAAVRGSVLDLLRKHYGCQMECFASPLNCRYERYCSAFPDTDAAFGSCGSFFDFDFHTVGGCFQANPPFVASFIHAMCQQMEHHLELASSSSSTTTPSKPLMFVVFVPAWKETSGWKALRKSKFCTKHELLKEVSHYYAEGTQHRRKVQFRVASFDTSVFFLQSTHGNWKVTKEQTEGLRREFARSPLEAMKEDDEQVEETAQETNEEHAQKTDTANTSTTNSIPEVRSVVSKPEKDLPLVDRSDTKAAISSSAAPTPRLLNKQSKQKKKNKNKKRRIDEAKEISQQLDILNSLGIIPPTESE